LGEDDFVSFDICGRFVADPHDYLAGNIEVARYLRDRFAARNLRQCCGLLLGVPFSRVYVRQLVINLGFSDRLRRTKGKGSSSSVLDSEALMDCRGAASLSEGGRLRR
jgi:hypothetical protein